MRYRTPSSRKRSLSSTRLNLIPILDAVFIFIFFLLMSANFIKIFEISSDVPIVSSTPPKTKKIPLALTIKITPSKIFVYTGVPSGLRRSFSKLKDGKYDLESLHSYLVQLKSSHPRETDAILEPDTRVEYEQLVEIMDSVRILRNTDSSIFIKGEGGIDIRVNTLFNKISFGNLLS